MADKQIIDFGASSSFTDTSVFHIHDSGVNKKVTGEDLLTTISGEILVPATTSVAGIVQLNNTTSSTSTTQAATANAVKLVNDGLTGKVNTSIEVIAGYGLTGGGSLSSDTTLFLGTPTTLTSATTNTVTPTSHTHAVTFPVDSVAGKTGVVSLEPADIVGLATVASTNSYNDLSDKPSIMTDAPSDGEEYVRKDAAWAIASATAYVPQFQRIAFAAGTATFGGNFISATDVDNFYTMDFSALAVGDMLEVNYYGKFGTSSAANVPYINFKLGGSTLAGMPMSPSGAHTEAIYVHYRFIAIKTATTSVSYSQELMTDSYQLSPKFQTLGHTMMGASTNALWNTSSDLVIRCGSPTYSRAFSRNYYTVDIIKAPV